MKEGKAGWRRWRWPQRLLVIGAAGLALFTVVGFLVIPPIARHVAEGQLTALLGRKVSIARIRLNPFALSLTVDGLQVLEADGHTPFVGFARLYVNVELASVYRRAPVVQEIRLESPRLHIERRAAGADAWGDLSSYNFSDIMARLAARPSPPPASKDQAPPRFSLNNIRVMDGEILFDDTPLNGHHRITALSVGVPFVSTLPVDVDTFVQPGASVRIDGTPFALQGRTKPFKDSLETILELRLDALDLTRYVPYVPVPLAVDVTSGRLTVALDISFARPKALAPTLGVAGRVALADLSVHEKRGAKGALLDLRQLELVIGKSDVTARRFAVTSVLVSGLDAHVRRLPDGDLNLAHLLAPTPTLPPTPAGPAAPRARAHDAPPRARSGPDAAEPPLRFTVGEIRIEKANVYLHDETMHPTFEAAVRDIALSVRGLSNTRGAKASIALGLRAVPGGTLAQHGSLGLEPLQADGSFSFEGLEPARFAPYFQNRIAFEIAGGRVRLGASYDVAVAVADMGNQTSLALHDAFFDLAGLALRRSGAKDNFFRMADLGVQGAAIDLGQRAVTIGAITTRNAQLKVARAADGTVDLTTLMATPATPATAPTSASLPSSLPPAPATATATATASGPAWTVALARFDLDGWSARFEDRAVAPRAVIVVAPLDLHVRGFSTAPGAKGTVDLRLGLGRTGRVSLNGGFGLDPLSAALNLDARALEIVPLQPYLKDRVNLTITDGTVAVKGKIDLSRPTTRPGHPPPEPRVAFAGDIDVADLATVDRASAESLVSWRLFHVGGLRLATTPPVVAIEKVALNDFSAHVTVLPDGNLNLQNLAAPASAGARPGRSTTTTTATTAKPPAVRSAAPTSGASPTGSGAAPGAPAPALTIGEVALSGGSVSFSDRSIHPRYAADLTDLAGHVTGLSPNPDTQATVDIRGAVDRTGVLTIAGKVNPLARDLSLAMKVDIKDFELLPLSPYAGKYIGLEIGKGKLSLSLDYTIANRKVDAKNRVVIDQLTFGGKVASPDAVNLPVRLAVAILKDRHGVIDLDVPIAGSLDDPQFRVGHAILKVLGDLVVKAVTAPFSLIASAFGGGDQLSSVGFPAGLASLDSAARDKMKSLAKALQERPELSFEIEGAADPARDRDGLRRDICDRKLKARKLAALVEAGGTARSADELSIDAAERPRLLEAAYQAETFAKPRNALGMNKSLPPEEMEKLILASIRIENDDLRALALRRATAVKEALTKLAPGGSARLFLVSPRLASPGNHVEFKLKQE